MKKKFKKLVLNTETLRTLNSPALEQVAGGEDTVTVVCALCTIPGSVCTRPCSICCP